MPTTILITVLLVSAAYLMVSGFIQRSITLSAIGQAMRHNNYPAANELNKQHKTNLMDILVSIVLIITAYYIYNW